MITNLWKDFVLEFKIELPQLYAEHDLTIVVAIHSHTCNERQIPDSD
jgi:hypothetical protein